MRVLTQTYTHTRAHTHTRTHTHTHTHTLSLTHTHTHRSRYKRLQSRKRTKKERGKKPQTKKELERQLKRTHTHAYAQEQVQAATEQEKDEKRKRKKAADKERIRKAAEKEETRQQEEEEGLRSQQEKERINKEHDKTKKKQDQEQRELDSRNKQRSCDVAGAEWCQNLSKNKAAIKHKQQPKKERGGEANGADLAAAGTFLLESVASVKLALATQEMRSDSEGKGAWSGMQGGDGVEWPEEVIEINGPAGGDGDSGLGSVVAQSNCLSVAPSTSEEVCDEMDQLLLELLMPCPQASASREVVAWSTLAHPEVDDSECCVCLETKKTHIFIPCAHFRVCEKCADSIMTTSKECPVCRAVIQQALKVF